MTPPTDAQIEAAAKAMYFCQHSIMYDHEKLWEAFDKAWLFREMAKAAITAAAEVEPREREISDAVERGYKYGWDACFASTIERCAQVAENYPFHATLAPFRDIAAAIHALKDKP